jgi:hypothetical protein
MRLDNERLERLKKGILALNLLSQKGDPQTLSFGEKKIFIGDKNKKSINVSDFGVC